MPLDLARSSADYSVFASPDFDANDYANAVLAGESYPSDTKNKTQTTSPTLVEPSAKEDVSVAISKLSFGIDDVSKQIKTLVTAHHEDLLLQAASANSLTGSLTNVKTDLGSLESSVEKLRVKIRVPYQNLQENVSRLQRYHAAADLLRRTSRFVVLARRLQGQMAEMESTPQDDTESNFMASISQSLSSYDAEDEKERTIAKAALSIAELVSLLDGPAHNLPSNGIADDTIPLHSEALSETETLVTPTKISLRSVNAVAKHISLVEDAQAKVTTEMESMVFSGLKTLNQSLLASSLQTAYNLRVLPELVQSLILDLSYAVEERIRGAFDVSKISKEAISKDSPTLTQQSPTLYKSRVRTEPTSLTAPQWTAALWSRLENMIEEMADCCIKVYSLEKVLKMKRDTVSQVVFLDEAMKTLESKPSTTFWASLGRSLEKCSRDSAKNSTFVQQTLSSGYPRLLRLFHEFFAKIAVHTDTVYIQTYQSPETVLVLRSISNYESLYLSRSTTKLNEAVGQAFSGGTRLPPGANEAVNVTRTVANELDSARFDPLLVRSAAKIVVASLDMLLSRYENMVVRDRSTVMLIGPSATPQQILNGSLASFLYHCWLRLSKLKEEHSDAVVQAISPTVNNIRAAYDRLVEPLLTAIRRELGGIISRLHRIDFGKSTGMGGGSSIYMKDLVEKLSYVKSEILSKYSAGDDGKTWVISIVKYVIRTFVLHISIAKPLSESGKLQLTSDMMELEFALSAFMVEPGQNKQGGNLDIIGEDYHVLRAMRPLLFLENSELASSKSTVGLPPLIILHHILVRSPIPLPHTIHGWQEAEYVRWIDEHSDEEALTLVEGAITHWETIAESEGTNTKEATEYIELARKVLSQTS